MKKLKATIEMGVPNVRELPKLQLPFVYSCTTEKVFIRNWCWLVLKRQIIGAIFRKKCATNMANMTHTRN